MRAIGAIEKESGWEIHIEFNERGKDRKRIEKVVFFPRISKDALPNTSDMTVHNFGGIALDEVIRFMPKSEDVMQQAPLHASLKTGRVFEKIGSEPDLNEDGKPQFMIMGYKNPITVNHPMKYMMYQGEWTPQVLLELLNQEEKVGRHIDIKKAVKTASDPFELLKVFKKYTVSLEAPKEAKKQEFEVVPFPKADGRSMQFLPDGNITTTRKASTKLAVHKRWMEGTLKGTDLMFAKFFKIVPQNA